MATGCLLIYRFLDRLQWDHKGLQKWEDDNVKKLVAHAYSSVPLYREIYDAHGVSVSGVRKTEDLPKLPVISKSRMKKAFPYETVSASVSNRRRRLTQTSGTGQMFAFYDDRKARGFVIASRLLFESWMGLALGDKTVMLTDIPERRTILLGEVRLPVSRLTRNPMAAVRLIRSLRPASLVGDVSIVSSLAYRTLHAGVDAEIGIRGITTISEVLLPNHRGIITEAFHSPVFDRYGLSEVAGYVAQECQEHHGLHVNTGLVKIEVLKDGQVCGPGETGRLIVTNLHNYAMPFIRYDAGDLATVGDECPCGRAFPVLARLEGRSPGWVLTKSFPISWTSFLVPILSMHVPLIEQFQFVQSKVGELTLLVGPRTALTTHQIQQLTERLNAVHPLVNVKLELVDFIEPTASGKYVLFNPLNAREDTLTQPENETT
jgi:phenylacetate-CoA ligase